jgi:hypothetical protein
MIHSHDEWYHHQVWLLDAPTELAGSQARSHHMPGSQARWYYLPGSLASCLGRMMHKCIECLSQLALSWFNCMQVQLTQVVLSTLAVYHHTTQHFLGALQQSSALVLCIQQQVCRFILCG